MTEKKIYLHCQCGCSILHLEKDEDFGVEVCMILFNFHRREVPFRQMGDERRYIYIVTK